MPAYHSAMIRSLLSVRLARWLAASLAVWLAVMPPAALAQIENLPKLGDAAGDDLSPAAERQLGESVMRQLRRDAAYLDDAEIADYLNGFAAPLLNTPAASGSSFEFFAIDDGSINAFALPGGFIGVHLGLIMAAESESELASVLAHEIGHVTQRHIARMMAQSKQMSLVSMAALVAAMLAARSNPQAAMGGLLLGDQIARGNMLSFSRDAEREADRVGFEMLRQAGFEPQAMTAFLLRLQQATRLYESNVPVYMRTHPLTGERIADMQMRQQETRYRQRQDSPEFGLLRARLRSTADESTDGRVRARDIVEQRVKDNPLAGTESWFGLAAIAGAQRDWARFDEALGKARALHGKPHPYFDRLEVSTRLSAGDAQRAAELARDALKRFPESRALARAWGESLIAAGQASEAVRAMQAQLQVWRSDPRLWELLSQALMKLDRKAEAHRAAAERFALLGSNLAAVDQLRVAQRAGDTDFYTASVIDARLRELEPLARRELEESRKMKR
jgi:predicted Zn-dependent protease